jgi:prolyl 4-hydroxylase
MVKFKHSRIVPRKWSLPTARTLIFTLFVTFTFLVLNLLSLRIPKLNHHNSIFHNGLRFLFNSSTTHISPSPLSLITIYVLCRSENGKGERWVEIISWEPRAILYHNFLVSFLFSLLLFEKMTMY